MSSLGCYSPLVICSVHAGHCFPSSVHPISEPVLKKGNCATSPAVWMELFLKEWPLLTLETQGDQLV